ncbi:hypothetical protein AWB75_02616 [Caballeronia catudaia]|uniref:Lipoprotein n=1 Tax=Caballeronia catudaia TaxID=1777136 RepID=A0A158AU18_9BURK|nr:hypothetical protein [Caballeronia catudaia]SAK61344.1 hypothetical protein AWB75_02616 [Caballeronia catudaia]
MNHRTRRLFFILFSIPLASLAGCTSYYKNAEACKDKARTDYPDAARAPLKITGTGASYHGSRVVVHGTIEIPPKPPSVKPGIAAAAAECTFSETSMTGFQWLVPAYLAPKPPAADADE